MSTINETKEIESISTALFDKVRSRFPNVTLGDESAKATQDPERARFFNFTYVDSYDADSEGEKFGKVTLSLIDENSLKVYYGQSISDKMDTEQRQRWYKFLRDLRQFAKRNLLTFDTRDINKSNLKLQDVKQQAGTDDVSTANDVQIATESRMYGTAHKSYVDIGECRLVIKHDGVVTGERPGERARKIQEIFIETPQGERFLVPFKSLHGARALAQHVQHGGNIHDERAEHIAEIVREMSAMSRFVRHCNRRQFEDTETQDMAESAKQRHHELKKRLRGMSTGRGYTNYFADYAPDVDADDGVDIDEMRERFVKKVYSDKIDDALPYVYRAHKRKNECDNSYADELEEWADDVFETAYNTPDNDDKVEALNQMMKTPLPAGINGIDAQNKIKTVIGDNDLNDAIYHYSQSQGADADTRPLIKSWIQDNKPEILDKINFGDKNSQDAETNYVKPVSPQQPADSVYGAANPPGDVGLTSQLAMESEDPFELLRILAGLKK